MTTCRHVDQLHSLLAMLDLTRSRHTATLLTSQPAMAPPTRYNFRQLLARALNEINAIPLRHLDTKTRDAIRDLLEDLRDLRILPSAIAYSRRYFCEMAYYREADERPRRFIRKALDALYRQQGYAQGLDDPRLDTVKQELKAKLEDFYSVHAAAGWDTDAGTSHPDPSHAALELSRLLIRLFLAEGLGVEILEAFKSHEKLIYFSNARYRDHYVHVVYCFLLGCRILDAYMPQLHSLRKQYSEDSISFDEHYVRTMRSWLVAGLLHDVGYSAENLNALRQKMQTDFFNHIPGFKLSDLHLHKEGYIAEATQASLALLASVLQENEFSFDSPGVNLARSGLPRHGGSDALAATAALLHDQLEEMDHGVVSALFLLLTLTVDTHEIGWNFDMPGPSDNVSTAAPVMESPAHGLQGDYVRRRASITTDIVVGCHAIAFHNIRQRAYRGLSVGFREHPIAWLLMLCDDLQEWDRSDAIEKSSDALRAVYGFDVLMRVTRPDHLFQKQVSVTDDEGARFESPTLFGYLCERVKQWEGAALDQQCLAEVAQTALWLKGKAQAAGTTDPGAVRRLLSQCLLDRTGLRPATREILRVALISLTSDIVTLTYVGGGEHTGPDCRIGRLLSALATLFEKNLTDGPAVCVLHGSDSDTVSLVLVEEYDSGLREYRRRF